jgi:hypothetical protein
MDHTWWRRLDGVLRRLSSRTYSVIHNLLVFGFFSFIVGIFSLPGIRLGFLGLRIVLLRWCPFEVTVSLYPLKTQMDAVDVRGGWA